MGLVIGHLLSNSNPPILPGTLFSGPHHSPKNAKVPWLFVKVKEVMNILALHIWWKHLPFLLWNKKRDGSSQRMRSSRRAKKTVEKQMNLLEEFPINRWWNVLQYYIILYFSQRGIWIHSCPKLTQTTKVNFLVLSLKVMLLGWFDEFHMNDDVCWVIRWVFLVGDVNGGRKK